MLGLFLAALDAIVLRELGITARRYTRKQIGMLRDDDEFIYQDVYDCDEFFTMLQAVMDYSNLDQETLLTLCGAEIYHLHQSPQCYSDITFQAFLHNLENISGYANDTSAFHCEETESDDFLLHYYYQWKGLEIIAVGFIKAVAKNVYHTLVEMKLSTIERRRSKYHACFLVKDTGMIDSSTNFIRQDASRIDNLNEFEEDFEIQKISHQHHNINWPITPEVFNELFPFNIVFDSNLTICGIGNALNRLCPDMMNSNLRNYFTIYAPSIRFTYTNIVLHQTGMFYLRCTKNCLMDFKGQMIVDTMFTLVVYICSPVIDSLEQMMNCKIFVSDLFYLTDTQEAVFLNMHLKAAQQTRKKLETKKHDLNVSRQEIKTEKKQALDLLHSVLPSFVVEKYLIGEEFKQMKYENVTVLFSDIEGFTDICDSNEPTEVVELLDLLFSEYDRLSEMYGVLKLGSYSDVYMISGTYRKNFDCPDAVLTMAFAMRKKAMSIALPYTANHIQVRIGIHTGPVVAAVLSRKMPQFCMFGHTMNKARQMCTHGSYGKIHVSVETHDTLIKANPDRCVYQFDCRGEIPVKEMGNLTTYFVEPCQDLTTKLLLHKPSYGFICYIFERSLRKRFGEIVTRQVRLKTGVRGDFYKYQVVSDNLITSLLQAAQELTGLTVDQLLEELGYTLYETCKMTSGHSMLLKKLGCDLKAFLLNLNTLLAYMTVSFSEMQAPLFRCENKNDDCLLLHYYSRRKGFEYMVIGIIKAVAKDIYDVPIEMEVLTRKDGQWGDKNYHVSFIVNGSNAISMPRSLAAPACSTTQWPYNDPEVFNKAAPCSILFDQNAIVVNVGSTIKELLPDIQLGFSKFPDHFRIIKPKIELKFTFDDVKTYQNTVLTLSPQIKQNSIEHNTIIKGQIKLLQEETMAVFLGEIRKRKVTDNDSLCLLKMNFEMQIERKLMVEFEETQIQLQKAQRELEHEAVKANALMHSILPNFAFRQLQQGETTVKLAGDKTILSSNIKDFTLLCQDCSPHEVAEMLDNLYALYDNLIEEHHVYKVETISDACVIAGGVLDAEKKDHVTTIVDMALDMRDQTAKVKHPRKNTAVQIQIGIHTGPVVAAMVGKKMVRYSLFGEAVNVAKDMESMGAPNRIHISEATYWSLPNKENYSIICQGVREIKSGTQMNTYFLERP